MKLLNYFLLAVLLCFPTDTHANEQSWDIGQRDSTTYITSAENEARINTKNLIRMEFGCRKYTIDDAPSYYIHIDGNYDFKYIKSIHVEVFNIYSGITDLFITTDLESEVIGNGWYNAHITSKIASDEILHKQIDVLFGSLYGSQKIRILAYYDHGYQNIFDISTGVDFSNKLSELLEICQHK